MGSDDVLAPVGPALTPAAASRCFRAQAVGVTACSGCGGDPPGHTADSGDAAAPLLLPLPASAATGVAAVGVAATSAATGVATAASAAAAGAPSAASGVAAGAAAAGSAGAAGGAGAAVATGGTTIGGAEDAAAAAAATPAAAVAATTAAAGSANDVPASPAVAVGWPRRDPRRKRRRCSSGTTARTASGAAPPSCPPADAAAAAAAESVTMEMAWPSCEEGGEGPPPGLPLPSPEGGRLPLADEEGPTPPVRVQPTVRGTVVVDWSIDHMRV